MFVSIENNIYKLRELERNKTSSEDFDLPEEKPVKKPRWTPGPNHPWKGDSFKKYVENTPKNRIY